jgi:hypothetical protein
MLPLLLAGAALGGGLGFLGSKSNQKAAAAATAQMQGQIQGGKTEGLGYIKEGKTEGLGYLDKGLGDASSNYIDPGYDASKWANPQLKQALGGDGWDASNSYWNGFMKGGPLNAAMARAQDGVVATGSAQGLSNSGAAAQAVANTTADMGYRATQDQVGNLFKEAGRGDRFAELGANANLQTGSQKGNMAMGAGGSMADIATGAASQMANATGWGANAKMANNPYNGFMNGALRGASLFAKT